LAFKGDFNMACRGYDSGCLEGITGKSKDIEVKHQVIVKKEVIKKVEQKKDVYLSSCDDYITLMLGGAAVLSIDKKNLILVINDLDYEVEEYYDDAFDESTTTNEYKFNNITKW